MFISTIQSEDCDGAVGGSTEALGSLNNSVVHTSMLRCCDFVHNITVVITCFSMKAESLAWHYADDIELVLNVEKREVQYRSSTRIGQHDWDVEVILFCWINSIHWYYLIFISNRDCDIINLFVCSTQKMVGKPILLKGLATYQKLLFDGLSLA
jgi:hypothetical protein